MPMIDSSALSRVIWPSRGALPRARDQEPVRQPEGGRSSVGRGKPGFKRSATVDANGILLGVATALANRHDRRSWA